MTTQDDIRTPAEIAADAHQELIAAGRYDEAAAMVKAVASDPHRRTEGLYLEFEPAKRAASCSYVRLVRVMNDGCSPHVLADWWAVASENAARRAAIREGATLYIVNP